MMAGRSRAGGFEAFTYHGGALEVARAVAPEAPTPWIDLSTGINPYAYPLPDFSPSVWERLPGRQAVADLEAQAAKRYGAKAKDVVAGAGSQALIQILARLAPSGVVGAFAPIYGGHAEAFARPGAPVLDATSLDALSNCAVAIVVNPNNPDGRIASRADLLKLHDRIAPRGGWLLVDEAFADFDGGEESLAPVLPERNALVLRSFGKTFGLGGLRLGFAIASPDIVERLRAALGPWPLSGPAIATGAKALADSEWIAATGARLAKDAARLDRLLIDRSWRIAGGTRLFRLAEKAGADTAFRRLLAAGILTRPFADATDRLRFGIPGQEAHWTRLAAALGG
jgi:cobalamin biosynthesis protein CobC